MTLHVTDTTQLSTRPICGTCNSACSLILPLPATDHHTPDATYTGGERPVETITILRQVEVASPDGMVHEAFATEYTTDALQASHGTSPTASLCGNTLAATLHAREPVRLPDVYTTTGAGLQRWERTVAPIGSEHVAATARPVGANRGTEHPHTTPARRAASLSTATKRTDSPFDPLTNLFSKAGFVDRFEQVAGGADTAGYATLAVAFAELGDATANLARETADRFIAHSATRIHTVLRPDDFAGRLGEHSFVVCLSAHPDHVPTIADRLRDALEQPFDTSDATIHTAANMVSVIGGPAQTPATLVSTAARRLGLDA